MNFSSNNWIKTIIAIFTLIGFAALVSGTSPTLHISAINVSVNPIPVGQQQELRFNITGAVSPVNWLYKLTNVTGKTVTDFNGNSTSTAIVFDIPAYNFGTGLWGVSINATEPLTCAANSTHNNSYLCPQYASNTTSFLVIGTNSSTNNTVTNSTNGTNSTGTNTTITNNTNSTVPINPIINTTLSNQTSAGHGGVLGSGGSGIDGLSWIGACKSMDGSNETTVIYWNETTHTKWLGICANSTSTNLWSNWIK